MRNISFAMTTDQVLARTKIVTRRNGWRFLKVGDYLRGVEKAMGLRKGQRPVQLCVVRVVSLRRERLDAITQDDVRLEGFPDMTPAGFVDLYCGAMRVGPDHDVARISFRYLLQPGELTTDEHQLLDPVGAAWLKGRDTLQLSAPLQSLPQRTARALRGLQDKGLITIGRALCGPLGLPVGECATLTAAGKALHYPLETVEARLIVRGRADADDAVAL